MLRLLNPLDSSVHMSALSGICNSMGYPSLECRSNQVRTGVREEREGGGKREASWGVSFDAQG